MGATVTAFRFSTWFHQGSGRVFLFQSRPSPTAVPCVPLGGRRLLLGNLSILSRNHPSPFYYCCWVQEDPFNSRKRCRTRSRGGLNNNNYTIFSYIIRVSSHKGLAWAGAGRQDDRMAEQRKSSSWWCVPVIYVNILSKLFITIVGILLKCDAGGGWGDDEQM